MLIVRFRSRNSIFEAFASAVVETASGIASLLYEAIVRFLA